MLAFVTISVIIVFGLIYDFLAEPYVRYWKFVALAWICFNLIAYANACTFDNPCYL